MYSSQPISISRSQIELPRSQIGKNYKVQLGKIIKSNWERLYFTFIF